MNTSNGRVSRIGDLLVSNGLLAALLVLIFSVAAVQPKLPGWASIEGVIRQSTDMAVIVFPLALLVIARSVDLSVGSVAALSGIVVAAASGVVGFPMAVMIGLFVGLLIGLLNGWLVSYLGLHPVVVTLGGLILWKGVALQATNASTIGAGSIPDAVLDFGIGLRQILHLPVHFYILVAVYLACWLAAHKHVWGERLYAVGGDERAAFLAGIDVKRVRFVAHVATGLGASLAGVLMLARSGAAHGSDGNGLEFQALAIVLLGGVSFQGGLGRIRGVLVALLFMSSLRTGLVLLKTPMYFQQMISGILIVAALYMNAVLIRRTRMGTRTT